MFPNTSLYFNKSKPLKKSTIATETTVTVKIEGPKNHGKNDMKYVRKHLQEISFHMSEVDAKIVGTCLQGYRHI